MSLIISLKSHGRSHLKNSGPATCKQEHELMPNLGNRPRKTRLRLGTNFAQPRKTYLGECKQKILRLRLRELAQPL